MAPESARTGNDPSPDWTQGPAKWGGAGFLGGAACVGLVWVLGAREPSPMLDRSQASITIPAEDVELAKEIPEPIIEPAHDHQPDTDEAVTPPTKTLALLATPTDALTASAPTAEAPSLLPDELEPEPLPESRVRDLEPSPSPVEDVPTEPGPRGDPALAIRIRVNVAGTSELELLPGIGPVIAQRIADDRAANGAFRDLRALQRVKGIGPKTAEKLAAHVRFD